MENWYMLTVTGADQPGIVAKITQALFLCHSDLGETSMMRLGNNFTMMLMVKFDGSDVSLAENIKPVTDALKLNFHIDASDSGLHVHLEPDICVTVSGADRAGMMACATGLLADAGFNIINLDSDVAGTASQPLYIMQIEGQAGKGIDAIEQAVKAINNEGIDASLHMLEPLLG